MLEILPALLGIALIDSLNPSALALTLTLLSTQKSPTRYVLSYVLGIFLTYFALGLALAFGATWFLGQFGQIFEHPIAYAIQGVLGAGLFIYSFFMPGASKQPKKERKFPVGKHPLVWMGLGVTITVVEFSTAVPYLGAIGLLATKALTPLWIVSFLGLYNLIFVLPPLALLLIYLLLRTRMQETIEKLNTKIQKEMAATLPWIIGIIGFLLLADSLRFFGVFGIH